MKQIFWPPSLGRETPCGFGPEGGPVMDGRRAAPLRNPWGPLLVSIYRGIEAFQGYSSVNIRGAFQAPQQTSWGGGEGKLKGLQPGLVGVGVWL